MLTGRELARCVELTPAVWRFGSGAERHPWLSTTEELSACGVPCLTAAFRSREADGEVLRARAAAAKAPRVGLSQCSPRLAVAQARFMEPLDLDLSRLVAIGGRRSHVTDRRTAWLSNQPSEAIPSIVKRNAVGAKIDGCNASELDSNPGPKLPWRD